MTELLYMLPPQGLPTEAQLAAWTAGQAALWEEPTAADLTRTIDNLQMSADVARLLAALPALPDTVPAPPGLPDDVAHDAYFRVGRVVGNGAAIFVRMAVLARAVLLDELNESPAKLSLPLLGLIDRALADLIGCACGGAVGTRPAVAEWRTPGSRPEVLPRWIRGHQIFAALTQGLVLSFGAMGRAIRAGDVANVERWADLTTSLLRGSGAAFVLTGDFTVEQYIESIRPSMMPPAVPICLSGLMSVDHRVLVQCIRDMKPALKSLNDHDPARHAQIHAELKTVYDRHVHVCARFVGDRPSLLTAGSTEKSGPALIAQFKTLRLKPFEVPRHAARLDAQPHPGQGCPVSAKPNEPQNSESHQHPTSKTL